MSKYTTEFRFPIEQRLDMLELSHSESNWPQTWDFAGLGDYPLYDESHRETLNGKIYRRFWFREIGFETWAHFKWRIRERMHEIMPYYNQLYESADLEIENPLYSKDMRYEEEWTRDEKIDVDEAGTYDRALEQTIARDTQEDTTQTTDEDTTDATTSSETGHARNVYQDTPMNGLDTGAIQNMDYATSVTYDDDERSASSNSTGTRDAVVKGALTRDYDERLESVEDRDTTDTRDEVGDYEGTKITREYGYDKSQSELLLEYRETFLNIDLMILRDLECMFLGLW